MPSKTLLFIKPDAVKRNLIGEIIKRIENAGFKVTALEMKKLPSKRTKEFYKIHKDKPFFNQLVKSIANKPIVGMILEKKNAVESLREFIGTTNPKKAKKGSIRADFGLDITRNSVHASDSVKNFRLEMKIFFK
jgi:nucleoside-diphosphate kinase